MSQNKVDNLNEFYKVIEDKLPFSTVSILNILEEVNKESDTTYSYDDFLNNLKDLCQNNIITKTDNFMSERYEKIEEE